MNTIRDEKTLEEMAPLCWSTTSCWPLSRDASHMPPDYPRGTTRADWRLEPVVTREGPGCLLCARAAGSAGLLSNRLQGGMSDHLWRFKVKLWVQWATSISNKRHHFDPPPMRRLSNRQFALCKPNGLSMFFIAVLHKMPYVCSPDVLNCLYSIAGKCSSVKCAFTVMRLTVPINATWSNINISRYVVYYFTLYLSSIVYNFQKEEKFPIPILRKTKCYCDLYNSPLTDRV